VADVLRKYSRISGNRWEGRKAVLDGQGHEVALDGELSNGERLLVRMAKPRRTP
jgi:hypothetical protein